MKAQRLTAFGILAFTIWLCGSSALASRPHIKKRSKSDANITAIGHRRITHATNLYSLEREKQLGKALSEEVERTSKLLTDPAITEYVDRVAQTVAKNSDARMPITVRVIDSDSVDAFTLPGGYQYVSRGLLLRLAGEGELASVLARGIAHTALRSSTTLATRADILQISTVPLSNSAPGNSFPSDAALAVPLTSLEMHRDDELDADYFGVQYLYKTGYDPECFLDFVQRIWGSGATATKVPAAFSAYPPLDERLAALRSEISKILPPRDGATVSTPEFDAFEERLRTIKAEAHSAKH